MPRLESELLSTLWDVAAAADDDLAWILSQLSVKERGILLAAIESWNSSATAVPLPRFLNAMREASGSGGASGPKAMKLAHLPDWLALRALLCITPDDRRAALRELPWRRRWSLRRVLWREPANLKLTEQAARTLVSILRDEPGAVVEGAPA